MRKRNFDFISGAICLDFADTVGNRRAEPCECLIMPRDLDRWLDAARLVCPFLERATQKNLADGRKLRDAIYRLALTAIDDSAANLADIEVINQWSAKMPLRPVIKDAHIELKSAYPVEGAFSTIAADAIDLIFGKQRSRIRICPDCRMVFVDSSRPGNRRWCSSAAGCGNRAKVREHRARINSSL
jgi:predicted RNA-binding Zn ribbon-like protein